MVDKLILKQVLASNLHDVEAFRVFPRKVLDIGFSRCILVGARRAGKSFMIFQRIQQMLSKGHSWKEIVYVNFEDDRLIGFDVSDFDKILECHAEMSDKRPTLFLDEIQNIDGWEKFARRVADQKYDVWITGSNAKMLSSEMMSTLGGRYMTIEVYPYSFAEFLDVQQVARDKHALLATGSRGQVMRQWNEYLQWGGMPEAVGIEVKRGYLSSTFQKIYLGDICSRNKISNPNLLRLMLKKLAESVCRPVSYNRLANVLSSINGKITMPTVSKYIECCEDAWLLLRLRNLSAPFADKETLCKYYFIDNGILNLFLFDGNTALLENAVALQLFRLYGHDKDNERVFFYNDKVEVDFYVPEEEMAIQVSFSISQSPDTYTREVDALRKLPKAVPCSKRLILTNDESATIEDDYGVIQVMPAWKWLLSFDR